MMNIPLEENDLEVAILSYLEVALKNSCVSMQIQKKKPVCMLYYL